MASVAFTPPRPSGRGQRGTEEAAPDSAQHHRPESPTRASPSGRPGPARTTSGKFEDPMLVWRSSQSDGACSSPGSHAVTVSPTSSVKQLGIPSSPSKQGAFRAAETVLDALAPGHSPTGTTPAALMSPVRSQSPNTRSGGRSGSVVSVGSGSMSPSASLFDKLRMFGGRGLFGGPTSDGGSRSSPYSKSLNFSGADELGMGVAERSSSYTCSPTRVSPLASPAAGIQSPFAPMSPRGLQSSGSGLRASTEEAAAAAIAAIDRGERERTSAGSVAESAAARNMAKLKSVGTRSMGGRALTVTASWRSSGALTLSSAASGALPVEGGLQSQTHEALQQLLGMNSSVDSAPNKRYSAPGVQPGTLHMAAPSALGMGRRVSREQGIMHSHQQLLVTHTEDVIEEGGEAQLPQDGSQDNGALMTKPPRARRFTRSLTDKMDEKLKLDLSGAVELSYADTSPAGEGDDEDDDVF